MSEWAMLESPDARCPKNPQRFLWFRWKGWHRLRPELIQPWGSPDWHRYEAWLTCRLCGTTIHRWGLPESKLAEARLNVPEIRAMIARRGFWHYWV